MRDKQLERIKERQRNYRARKKARREAEALKKALALAMNGPLAGFGPLAEYLHELRASLLPENPTAQHRQAVELALRAKVRADSLSAWLDGLPIEARLDPRILAVESEARHLRTALRLHLQTLRATPARAYGTLMTVFTIVTDAFKSSSLPLIVVIAATPAVETEMPA